MRKRRNSVLASGLVFAGLIGLVGCSEESLDEREEAGLNELTADFHRNYVSVEVKEKDCTVVYHIPRVWVPEGVEPKDYLFTEDYKKRREEYKANNTLRR